MLKENETKIAKNRRPKHPLSYCSNKSVTALPSPRQAGTQFQTRLFYVLPLISSIKPPNSQH